jgi:hypothetical protein
MLLATRPLRRSTMPRAVARAHSHLRRAAEPVAHRAASALAAALVAAAGLTSFTPAAQAYGACELLPAHGVQYCDIKVGKGEEVKGTDTIEMVYQVRHPNLSLSHHPQCAGRASKPCLNRRHPVLWLINRSLIPSC